MEVILFSFFKRTCGLDEFIDVAILTMHNMGKKTETAPAHTTLLDTGQGLLHHLPQWISDKGWANV